MSATLPSISSSPAHSMTPAVTSFGVSSPPTSPVKKARVSIVSASLPNLYDIYPPRLPPATDIPAKLRQSRPLPPFKMTTSHETAPPTYSNHYRAMRLKQREHYRFHSVWSKYYYGSVADKQQQGAYFRSVLKQQMDDKATDQRDAFMGRVWESEMALQHDLQSANEDAAKAQIKRTAFLSYRDANKLAMETKWRDLKERKVAEDLYDREQLQFDPINWSKTLK